MIIFANVELDNPEEPVQDFDINLTQTRLLSGKNKVQAATGPDPKFSFTCHTTDPAHIPILLNLIGTSGTLQIDSLSYSNCFISSFKKIWEGNNQWTYEISFVRDTT